MFDTWGWIVAGVAVLLTGMSKTGMGGAVGGLAVPLMAVWVTPRDAAAVMLPILVFMDALALRAYWGQWDGAELVRLIPGAVIGVGVASLVFGVLPGFAVKVIAGGMSIGFAVYRLVGSRPRGGEPGRPIAGTFWGALSGFTSTIAHAGGPPLLVYLLGRNLDKRRFLATAAAFFAAVNFTKIVPYVALHMMSRRTLLATAELAPLAPLGTLLGLRLQRSMPERPFFIAATLLLGLSGAKLLLDGLAQAWG